MPNSSAFRVQPGARMETPLCRLAQTLAGLAGWRRYATVFLLGALLAGALPPFDLALLVFLVFPGLLWLDEGSATPWASARLGYVFDNGLKLQLDGFNIFNTQASQIDYFYASRLRGETGPVNDIHFHPVEPFALRFTVAKAF